MSRAGSAGRSSAKATGGRGIASRIRRTLVRSSSFQGRGTSFSRSKSKGVAATCMAVLAVAVASMALAPAANADPKAVSGFFGSGDQGGGGALFFPADVAVNDGTGDIYVVDSGNNRVQRFSAEGAFELAWGKNAIINGQPGDTGNGYEVCTVAHDCQEADRGGRGGELFQPGGIAVDQSDGSVYVTDQSNNRVQKFTADGEFLLAWGKDVVVPGGTGEATAGAPRDERQTVELKARNGNAQYINGGTFTLSFDGQTTEPIVHDASVAAVDASCTIGSVV